LSLRSIFWVGVGFGSGGGVANHPRRRGAICLGRGDSRHSRRYKNPRGIFFARGFGSGGGVANHPRRRGTTRLGAEVGSAIAAGVISGSPRREFICRIQCLVEAGLLQITPAAPPLPTLAPWW
jgi:hypothetical protein